MILSQSMDQTSQFRSLELMAQVSTVEKGVALLDLRNYTCNILCSGICLLHMNELLLRHLFAFMDGQSSGPRTFTGIIGKKLEKLTCGPIVNFAPLPGKVQPISTALKKCLSTDQRYLAAISLAIQGGPGCYLIGNSRRAWLFSHRASGKKPGTMYQARWVTMANRILRLYADETEPSWVLRRLASFVLNVYAPSFFTIKTNWDITCGPKNFHYLVSFATSFLTQEKKVVEPVLVNNSYYTHPENVLLAALTDPSETVRTSAPQKIVAARDRAASADSQEIC